MAASASMMGDVNSGVRWWSSWSILVAASCASALTAGCASGEGAATQADEPAETVVVDASLVIDDPDTGSILELVSVGQLEQWGTSGQEIADLLLPPASLGQYRVAAMSVDDPNGDGRIGDRWYPPRVRSGDCSISIDAAPIPSAGVTYVPGRPTTVWSGARAGQLEAITESDVMINVGVFVFDDSVQRDAYRDAMLELYESEFRAQCGASSSGAGSEGVSLAEVTRSGVSRGRRPASARRRGCSPAGRRSSSGRCRRASG
jgi:hypothetical protein